MSDDVKDILRRAEHRVPTVPFDLSDLERRRHARRRNERIRAGALGLALAVIASAGVFVALRPHAPDSPGQKVGPAASGPAEALPAATEVPLVAGPGQYYYSHIHYIGGYAPGNDRGMSVNLDAEFWWRDDGSGRIAVAASQGYGIQEGTFGPGEFPNGNGIDVSSFPTDPAELADFLLARSQPDGASPAPLVTPPPDGAPQDGRMWRAITDLLGNPQVTPTIRAALMDVAAGLQGSHVELGVTDPAGRPADAISFGNWGGDLTETLYVDPASHELLAWTTAEGAGTPTTPYLTWLVESAGLADSTDADPTVTSIPTADLPA